MATYTIQPPEWRYSSSGVAPEMENSIITASLLRGELLVKTNNTVVTCGADPTVVTHVMPDISANVIPGTTLQMSVYVAKSSDVWEATIYHSTPSLAVFADAALDGQPDYGTIKATVSGNTAWCVDIEETSAKVFRVIARAPGFTGTDVYPRVYAQFLAAVCMRQA